MTSMRRLFAVTVVMGLFLSACGSGSKVGDGLLEQVGEGKGGPRLGEKAPEAPAASPTPLSLETSAPEPPKSANSPPPAPEKDVLEIFLLSTAPYYQVEGQPPGQEMKVPVGATIRWVNKETNKDREPFSRDLFDCPRLKPGGTCDFFVNVRGKVTIEDRAKPFATGILEMQ